jgi:ribosomal silencing factor RsfS
VAISMNSKHAFSERLAQLQSWRLGLTAQLERVSTVLAETGFLNGDDESGLADLRSWISDERVTIVFVAESARGKSELINAMFFSDLGRRLLPSGLNRTTRCVTELRFDRAMPTGLRLLPIETRESPRAFADLYRDETVWESVPFTTDDPASITKAMTMLSETRRVLLAEAVSFGMHGASARRKRTKPESLDSTAVMVDVPRWRHAIVNFPHPLLDAGLVVLDTPSLATFFGESELAQDRVLNADGVVLILDAAEGVSASDLTAWKEHLAPSNPAATLSEAEAPLARTAQARLVALNKIDDVDGDAEQDASTQNKPFNPNETMRGWLRAIDRRVQEVADTLQLDPIHIVPISAKLGLIGKLARDQDKVVKSRVYQLERSLASNLPKDRQDRLGADVLSALTSLIDGAQARLDEERFLALDNLRALQVVRAKNDKLMSSVIAQTKIKQTRVTTMLRELRSIKPTQLNLSEQLSMAVDVTIAKYDSTNTYQAILASVLPNAATEAVNKYFANVEARLNTIDEKITQIRRLFSGVGEKMRAEFGNDLVEKFDVHPFPTQRFHTELVKLREKTNQSFGKTSNLMMRRSKTLAEQFQSEVAPPVEHIFVIAHRESSTWLRGLYKSVEKPLEAAHDRLTHREEGIEKAESATLDLAERISSIQGNMEAVKRKHVALSEVREALSRFAGTIGQQGRADIST